MSNPPIPSPAPKKGLSGLAIAGIGCAGLLLVIGIGATIAAKKAYNFVKENAGDFQKNPERAGVMMALKLNPAIEVISTDDNKNTVTFKDKSSGKVMNMSFEDIKNGKFSMTDESGKEVISVDGSQVAKGGKLTMKDGKGGEVTFNGDKNGSVVMKGPNGESSTLGGNATAPDWIPSYPGATPGQGNMRSEHDGKITGMTVVETTDAVKKVTEFYDSKLKAAGFTTEVQTINTGSGDNSVIKGTKDSTTVNAIISTNEGKTAVLINYEGPK